MEDRGWRMEDGGWRMEDGGWRMEDGGWKMEEGGWKTTRGANARSEHAWTNRRECACFCRCELNTHGTRAIESRQTRVTPTLPSPIKKGEGVGLTSLFPLTSSP